MISTSIKRMQEGPFACQKSTSIARNMADDLQVAYDEEVDIAIALPTIGLSLALQALANPKPKYVPIADELLGKYQQHLLICMIPHLGAEEYAIASTALARDSRMERESIKWNVTRRNAGSPKDRSICNVMCAIYGRFPIGYKMVFATANYLDIENFDGIGIRALAGLEQWLQEELNNA